MWNHDSVLVNNNDIATFFLYPPLPDLHHVVVNPCTHWTRYSFYCCSPASIVANFVIVDSEAIIFHGRPIVRNDTFIGVLIPEIIVGTRTLPHFYHNDDFCPSCNGCVQNGSAMAVCSMSARPPLILLTGLLVTLPTRLVPLLE